MVFLCIFPTQEDNNINVLFLEDSETSKHWQPLRAFTDVPVIIWRTISAIVKRIRKYHNKFMFLAMPLRLVSATRIGVCNRSFKCMHGICQNT